jgi:hypothetical protein
MTAGQLAELAVDLVPHLEWIIERAPPLSPRGIAAYWTASKCRLDRWNRELCSLADFGRTLAVSGEDRFTKIRPVIEEILVSEPLTRLWAAICTAYDRQRSLDEASSLAKSIYVGHLESRLRALQLIKAAAEIGIPYVAEIDLQRRSAERWTDILLSKMSQFPEVEQFALDASRLQKTAAELSSTSSNEGSERRWAVLLASMKSGMRRSNSATSNSDLNHSIAVGILSCLPPDTTLGIQFPAEVWVARLTHLADDANDFIDEALRNTLPVS